MIAQLINDTAEYFEPRLQNLLNRFRQEDINGKIADHKELQIQQVALMYLIMCYYKIDLDYDFLKTNFSKYNIKWDDLEALLGKRETSGGTGVGNDQISKDEMVYPSTEDIFISIDIKKALDEKEGCELYII